MAAADDIVVEVIVWDGIFRPFNPWGHITTKITNNDMVYSYSLGPDNKPNLVCDTESFGSLSNHEQGIRDGFGFVLDITQEQAKKIFLYMQRSFHSYNSSNCDYHFHSNNCTYAIQKAMEASGIKFVNFVTHNPVSYIHPLSYIDIFSKSNDNQTMMPAFVEEGLLKTKNNDNRWLVKEIYYYKKGDKKGNRITENQTKITFDLKVEKTDQGWHALDSAFENKW